MTALMFLVSAAYCFTISEAKLTVYRDGVVHADAKLAVKETEPVVTIPLLAWHACACLLR